MSKTLKFFICILLIVLFFCNFSFVRATEADTKTAEETTEKETVAENNNVVSESASDISPLSVFNPSTETNVSNINSYEQANLQLNNILSVILIAMGFLLVLFSIAILIRLGK